MQQELWPLVAAMDHVNFSSIFTNDIYGLMACVPSPYVIITGEVNVTPHGGEFYVSCITCNLTPCVSTYNKGQSLLVLKQPVYVMIPVNLTEEWCEDGTLGLLVFGVVPLIGIIAGSTVAAISVSQTVPTAHYVNQSTSNVSQLMATQEDVDQRLEARLAALEAATVFTGDELEAVRFRQRLRCHSNYVAICVTPEIDEIQYAHLDIEDPAKIEKTLCQLQGFNPFGILRHAFWVFMILVACVITLFVVRSSLYL
ncbi:envelope glycoprotein [Plecturocebus cupreus]